MVNIRKKTRAVFVGKVQVGGGAPISVQSMTKTDTRDVIATINQINELAMAGCEIIRVAIPDYQASLTLSSIIEQISIPVIADIHFDYILALQAIQAGVAGLRINPGNIGGREKVKEIVSAAKDREIPIRIGVNAGSLEKILLDKYGGVTPEAMVDSAMNQIRYFERLKYNNIKISLKASNIATMLKAYRLLSDKTDYPLHVGVTEAGPLIPGAVKSAVGIGILLNEGIGDTIRVSLTGDPIYEVKVAYDILRSLGIRYRGAEIISCPTCGRTEVDIIRIVNQVQQRLESYKKPIKVAVMGCLVNGPGEAREADIGIAGGKGQGLIFRKGKAVKKVPENILVEELFREIEKL